MNKIRVVIILEFFIFSILSTFFCYGSSYSPEKLYLHLDRNYYSLDEVVLFSGYLEEAPSGAIGQESRFIYVELMDNEEAVSRAKIKSDFVGRFSGYLDLPDTLSSGLYTLRAYTRWQMNRPPEYMFNTTVRICGVGEEPLPAPSESDDIDVTFYPEGGRYFAGRRSVVGFKAMNSDGSGADIKGCLTDNAGDTLQFFESGFDGMGTLTFIPQEGETYYLNINDSTRYELPKTSSEGAAVNVMHRSGTYFISIFGRITGNNGPRKLLIGNSSEETLLAEFTDETVSRTLRLPDSLVSPGINRIILLDGSENILSDRLFYKYSEEDDNVNVSLSFDKKSYSPRERVIAKVTVSDSTGKPLQGDFSIAVLKGVFGSYQQEDNIGSYMRLSSELKGHINSPKYYFDKSVPFSVRSHDMDMLMMIQGWRYYDFFSDETAVYEKELSQGISGILETWGKKPNDYIITAFCPTLQTASFIDVSGAGEIPFELKGIDIPDSTTFILSATDSKGKNRLSLFVDDEIFAPEGEYQVSLPKSYISPKKPVDYSATILQFEGETLSPATVEAKRSFYWPKEYVSPFSTVFERRQVRTREELKVYDFMDIPGYIIANFPGFAWDGRVMYSNRTNSIRNAVSHGKIEGIKTTISRTPTKLYIDGQLYDGDGPWDQLRGLNISNVQTLYVLRGPEAALYNTDGGVVLITLRHFSSSEINEADKRISLNRISTVPLGYQKPARFYSPKYDTKSSLNSSIPDKRNTIFWSPMIITDPSGCAEIEFYTGDDTEDLYLRIEGRTAGEKYFSKENVTY